MRLLRFARNGEFLRLPRRMLTHSHLPEGKERIAQWRMVVPLRGCASCSRGSLVFHNVFTAKDEIATGTTCPRNGSGAVRLLRFARNGEFLRLPQALRATCRRQGKECAMANVRNGEFLELFLPKT